MGMRNAPPHAGSMLESLRGLGYASATADNFTIEITVRTDQLLDTAKVLTELELI